MTAVEPDWVMAEACEIERGECYNLVLTAHPPWPARSQLGEATLETGVPQQPSERIRFFIIVPPRVTVQPRRFEVPVPNYRPTELRARLEWSSEAPPGRILEATVDCPSLTVRVEQSANGRQVILRVPAGWEQPAEKRYCYVRLATNDPLAPVVRILIKTVPRRGTPP